ncbi:O-methyltransferase-domain-containing protein [Xylariales sp. PMI_506]|nr:O-methyltransferase-domain-containing protein [Xylariales sp. PMI_506]
MAQSSTTLQSLAASIGELTEALTSQLKAASFPEPSFDPDAPESLPPAPEVQGPRLQLIENLTKMLHLVVGPSEYYINHFMINNESLTLDVLNHFDFWHLVPLDGSATYAELAAATQLPEQFEAPGADGPSNRVAHTAASAYPAREPLARSLISHCMRDSWPAAVVGVEALDRFFVGQGSQGSEEPGHCPFNISSEDGKVRGKGYWEFASTYEKPGQPKGYRSKIFAEAMAALSKSFPGGIETVLEKFDWESLGEATVLDVGGSTGHVSATIAKTHPKLKFVVQDLPEAREAFEHSTGSSELASRISFQAHDFFTPQTVSADAYLFKLIFHDWSDKYALKIFKQLIPALKPGAHILIFDFITPPTYGPDGKHLVPLPARRLIGGADIQMFVMQNAKERAVEDWTDLVRRADERLEVKAIHVVPGFPQGLIDIVFKG